MIAPQLRTELSEDQVREFLVAREGLTHAARRRFLEILDRYGAFGPVAPRRTWGVLALSSLVVSCLCSALDSGPVDWAELALWPGSFLISIVPLWQIRRQEKRPSKIHHETEWRAYCLFLRPLILAEHPGLLDRNLVPAAPVSTESTPRTLFLMRESIAARGPDTWRFALAGTWCGMIVLLALRDGHIVTGVGPSFLLPLAGLLLGPLLGSLLQSLVYRFAQNAAHDA